MLMLPLTLGGDGYALGVRETESLKVFQETVNVKCHPFYGGKKTLNLFPIAFVPSFD